jgi:multiple antibiotic resistance protein
MQHFIEVALLAIAALFPIVDPLGSAPLYLAMTAGLDPKERVPMAKAVARNSFLLLAASTLVGAYVLDFFGISIPAVRVAGGAVVCAIGWSILNKPDSPAVDSRSAAGVPSPDALHQRAFYPLTMPLTVGPGSISVAVTLGANPETSVRSLIVTALAHLAGVFLIGVSVYVCYRYAEPILTRLGSTGTAVLMRLSAFILLCIGVQISWNGIHALLVSAFPAVTR